MFFLTHISFSAITLPVLNRYVAHSRHTPTVQQSVSLFLSIHSHLAVHSAFVGLSLLDFILFHFSIYLMVSLFFLSFFP